MMLKKDCEGKEMLTPFKFDAEIALEAILYIAKRVSDPTCHNIAKVLYLADQIHLEQYGRFISGDTYVAMDYGPVPSGTYDIMNDVRRDRHSSISEKAKAAFGTRNGRNYEIIPFRDANLDYFSESDLECLDRAVNKIGEMSFNARVDISHDDAYHASRQRHPDQNAPNIMLEDIVAQLDNSELLLDYLENQYAG